MKISEIAELVGATVEGDEDLDINGLAKIEQAESGQLSFIANPKYAKFIETTGASAVIVDHDFPKSDKTLLRAKNPYFTFLQLTRHFYRQVHPVQPGVHHSAVLEQNVSLGKNVAIGSHVYIGENVDIGDNTVIYPGVFIGPNVSIGCNTIVYANVSVREACTIGNDCILHMGAVIGSDGFGFAFEEGEYHKLPQMGNVVIQDKVEIGANTTIDRATLGSTIIKTGAKLDNLIQIAHNVEIGEHTAIAAQTGISGSTQIGRYVQIGGQVGIVGHIKIHDKVILGAQAGVTKEVPEGEFYNGYPARPFKAERKQVAALYRLPELLKKVREMELKIDELEEKLKL